MNHIYQKSKLAKNILMFFVIALVVAPSISLAQQQVTGYTPLAPLPCIAGNGITCSNGTFPATPSVDFQTYVQYAFNVVIALAAAAAIFMIVWGGFEYMTTDSWQNKTAGLDRARNAVYGLLLVLCSYLILRTVNPQLVNIPTTLVTPLKVNYQAGGGLDALFGNVLSDQVQYDASLNTFKGNIADAQDTINKAQETQSNLYNQITAIIGQGGTNGSSVVSGAVGMESSDGSNAGIDELCADFTPANNADGQLAPLCQSLNQTKDTIAKAQSNIALNKAEGSMLASLQQCAAGDTACLAQNNSSITSLYNQYSSQLQPDQLVSLKAYNDYSSSLLDISSKLSDPKNNTVALNSDVSNVTAAINQYASSPNPDPNVLAQMRAQLQKTTDAVNTAVTSTKGLGTKCIPTPTGIVCY